MITDEMRRRSAVGLGLLPLRVLPRPDGGLDFPQDGQHGVGLYTLTPPVPPPPAPTEEHLADLLSGRYGAVRARNRALRYDSSLQFLEDVSPALIRASIELDNDRATVRTAKFRINPALFTSFDLDNDRLKVVREIYDPTVDVWLAFDLGVFLLDEPVEETDEAGTFWDVDAADIAYLLITTHIQTTYVIPRGSNYVQEIEALLDLIGLPHEIPASALTTKIEYSWPWQTYYFTILNDLLDGINYYPVWADIHGTIRSRERTDTFNDPVAVQYGGNVEPKMILPPWTVNRTVKGSWFNSAICVQGDPARKPIWGSSTNIDPTNALSTVFQILKVKELKGDFMPKRSVMKAAATYYVRDTAYSAETATLLTYPDPRREARELYEVSIPDGSPADTWVKYRPIGWSLSLEEHTASMRHRLQRVTSIVVDEDSGIGGLE